MTKYLITGGAGFIGSNLARFLLDKGHDVVVLDNFATGKRENLQEILGQITLIEGDIRDRAAVDRAMGDATSATTRCAAVFHQGALGSVPRSVNDPVTSHDVNVNGTVTVLEAAKSAGLQVIYTPLCGAGNKPVREILGRIGVNVTVVPEQEAPDGNFPGCPKPNPEIREAFNAALEMAQSLMKKGQTPDLLLATDPDCDRVGIAVLENEKYTLNYNYNVACLCDSMQQKFSF